MQRDSIISTDRQTDRQTDRRINIKCNQRNSSIELLKIAAILMIVFSHAIPNSGAVSSDCFIDLSLATSSLQQLLLVFMKYAGQLGNDIFIVCSAWFLLNSRNVKTDKIFHIVLDSFLISVLFVVSFIVSGYKLTLVEIVKNFIPITMNNNWFVGCYILLYLLHPVLNKVIASMTKKELLIWNIITAVLYCGINLIIHDRFYYTQLVGFICIYFFVAYMKIYMTEFSKNKQKNLKYFFLSACCFVGSIVLFNVLGLKITPLNGYVVTWSIIINPFIIIMSLTILNLINRCYFANKVINYLSGLSLLIYIIHANCLVQGYLKMDFFADIYFRYSYEYILVWVIIFGVVSLVFGTVLAIIYKETIQKLAYYIYSKVKIFLCPIIEKSICFLLEKK